MKNWRRIIVTGMVAGMIAVTGCSSNVPETNQGNRNGQRVVDAVNRRTDSYGLTRARNTGERTVRGFTRGFRRATRNDGATNARNTSRSRVRHYNHVAHPGVVDGVGNYRHHGLNSGVTRNTTPNRSSSTLNRGRVGHTFGYDHYGSDYAHGMDGEYGGYDLGMRARTRVNNTAQNNAANINNRVVRSTPVRKATTHNRTANTGRKATAHKAGVTRSTGIKRNTITNVARNTNVAHNTTAKTVNPTHKATKAVQPTRSTTRNTQVNHNTTVKPATTARPTVAPVAHKAVTRGTSTQHMLHNTNTTGTVTHSTPVRSRTVTNTQGQRRLSARAERARNLHQNTRNEHLRNDNIANATPIMNANPVVNRSATRNINRVGQISQNRSARRTASRTTGTNSTSRRLHSARRPHNVNINDFNLAHRGINNSMNLGPGFYMSNNDANSPHGGIAYNRFDGSATALNHTVPVNSSDDGKDYAFFKRNKTNDEAPTMPEPTPQAPARTRTNRNQPVPTAEPAASPIPTSLGYDYNDYDNIHDYNEAEDNNYVDPIANTDSVNYSAPTPTRRAMK